MKNKSSTFRVLLICLVMLIAVIGCEAPSSTPPAATASKPVASATPSATPAKTSLVSAPDASWPKAISVGTPSASGFSYIGGTSIAVMIQNYTGVTATPENMGGSAPVINGVALKKIEIGLCSGSIVSEAYFGQGAWVGKPVRETRLILGGPVSSYPITVMADSDIKTVTDIKNKKFMYISPTNTFFAKFVEAVMKQYGMTKNDVVALSWTDQQQVADALFGGTISAGMNPDVLQGNTPSFLELSRKKPIRFLDIPKDKLEAVVKELGPSISVQLQKGGKYAGVEKDMFIVSQSMDLIGSKDLPDSLVTKILKVFWDEHLSEFQGYHPSMLAWTSSNTLAERDIIPFHPGVIKFYQEKGLWTKELQDMQDRLLSAK